MTEFNTGDLRRVEEEMSELELRLIEEAMARVRAEADIRLEHVRAESDIRLEHLRAESEMKLEHLRTLAEERSESGKSGGRPRGLGAGLGADQKSSHGCRVGGFADGGCVGGRGVCSQFLMRGMRACSCEKVNA